MANSGQCLCGAIRYSFPNDPAMTGVCHCKNCQRQAGSAFSTRAGVPVDGCNVTQGQLKLYADADTKSGSTVSRYFCGNCGSPIYSAVPAYPDQIFLKTGTMDETVDFAPQFHAWCSTKQNWVQLEDGIPQMES